MQEIANNISIESNDSNKRHDERLKQLKKQIILSQKQLQSLFAQTSNKLGKYAAKTIEYIHFATQNLQNDQPDEALVYLMEAEKILEKAGQKYQDVQKKLVICTLHNLACCHQKNWELEVCSNYLQALIFNLNSIIKELQNSPQQIVASLSTVKVSQITSSPRHLAPKAIQLMISIQAKERLGRYYLQFCAVNSQIHNHSGALISARKSIQTMKKMFRQLLIFLRHYNSRALMHQQNRESYEKKLRLIHQVSKINDNINVSQYEMILETTKYYLKKWQLNEQKQMFLSQIQVDVENKFRNFSIGSIAQMHTFEYKDLFQVTEQKKAQLLKTQSIIQKVLVMIIGYFTISTELRLLAQTRNPISQVSEPNISSVNPPHSEQETRQAQIYHLFSIMLASIFIPFQILYMKHILLSYKNHYNVDLIEQKSYGDQNSKMFEEFLFTISQIKKNSLLGIEGEQSLWNDKKDDFFSYEEKKQFKNIERIKKTKKSSHLGVNINSAFQEHDEAKSKSKRKNTKSKSKSQNKKSTLKTISALSAQSKNKQKATATHSKSPQIHTQPSLSKSKNKKSSLLMKSNHNSSKNKITSLQMLAEDNVKKRQKSRENMKRKNEYGGIKTTLNDGKKRKNQLNQKIGQTNAYFLKKDNGSQLKSLSKSKSKDSKIKKQTLKSLTPNNPLQLYFHKMQSTKPKSKSKQKSVKKSLYSSKIQNATSPTNTKKNLYMHYL